MSDVYCFICLTVECNIPSHSGGPKPQNDNGIAPDAIHVWIDRAYHGCLPAARAANKLEHLWRDLPVEQRPAILSQGRANDNDGMRPMIRAWADGVIQYGWFAVDD